MSEGRAARGQAGFTLIELTVAMVVLGILLAIAAPAWRNYQVTQERVSATGEVVSVMRTAQIRATAEETTYRIDVDAAARTLSLHRFDGADFVFRGETQLTGGGVRLTSVAFADKGGLISTSAYFYARGTASPGKLVVSHQERNKKDVITVEGLTGRVSST